MIDQRSQIENDQLESLERNQNEEVDHVDSLDEGWLEKLRTLQKKIDYSFKDISLLEQALTHRSSIPDGSYSRCNERMEFLGDSVLNLVISSFLYGEFPEYTEGKLTKLKAVVVSQPILASCSRELGLGELIKFGHGEILTGGKNKPSNLANALEALIGAIYLDGGFEPSRRFILSIFKDKIAELDKDETKRDYKSALQEYWQLCYQESPVYTVINQTGPDHDKRFEVEVRLSGKPYGIGIGKSKKEAEQRAAEKALEIILQERRENKS